MKDQALSNEQYMKETHSGPEPPWNEITTVLVVRKVCAGSAFGLNEVTYKVYKKCPKIVRIL